MTNADKYLQAFVTALGIRPEEAAGLTYQGIAAWDSVGHMNLISALEDAFDIMLKTDDVIDLSSFEKGREILEKGYGISF